MSQNSYAYAIVGGGLAAASAIQGIRERDPDHPIILLSREGDFPYHRPPLSKDLWLGKKKVEDIFVQSADYFQTQGVELKLSTEITDLDPSRHEVRDAQGNVYRYEKLLLATGGAPRLLDIPGGTVDGICYYRNLADYRRIRAEATPGKSAVVIGGGFIGSEIAAALNSNQVSVTMIFPDEYLVRRVFPESLGQAIQEQYRKRGIRVFTGDAPVSFERAGQKFVTHTRSGLRIESDMLIVGVGLQPSVQLAQTAGLSIANGISVNKFLQTSHPDIYAAGDNAYFPYAALGHSTRVEHWDNALNQGKIAGRNMAGAAESYDYLPFFYSDLFEFGYEAVGEVDARLEIVMDWQKENDTGIIYYTKSGIVRGAMMCNVWNKVEWARELIRKGECVTTTQLPKTA